MKKKLAFSLLFLLSVSLSAPVESFAMMHGKGRNGPYGGYCRGPRWGWYGAQRDVRTAGEVRDLLTTFLRGTRLIVGEIREEETYFEADITDGPRGSVVDVLLVDKRTCRIRSKY